MRNPGASPKSRIPAGTNGALAAAFVALGVLQGWVLPAVLLPRGLQWAWLLVPGVALANPAWALLHESFHGTLHPHPRVDQAMGRVLAVLYGAPFNGLRFGHLSHHRYNRSVLDRTEVYDPARQSRWRFALGYYLHLLGGLYWSEVAMSMIVLLPRRCAVRLVNWRLAGDDPTVAAVRKGALTGPLGSHLTPMRVDAVAILLFHGISFWLYGAHGWLLLAALSGRGLLVSISDNAYHYGTPVTERGYAKNLRLGAAGSAFLLHFNFHQVHHRYPYLPWQMLPRMEPAGAAFAEPYWTALLRQFQGPIPLARLQEPAR